MQQRPRRRVLPQHRILTRLHPTRHPPSLPISTLSPGALSPAALRAGRLPLPRTCRTTAHTATLTPSRPRPGHHTSSNTSSDVGRVSRARAHLRRRRGLHRAGASTSRPSRRGRDAARSREHRRHRRPRRRRPHRLRSRFCRVRYHRDPRGLQPRPQRRRRHLQNIRRRLRRHPPPDHRLRPLQNPSTIPLRIRRRPQPPSMLLLPELQILRRGQHTRQRAVHPQPQMPPPTTRGTLQQIPTGRDADPHRRQLARTTKIRPLHTTSRRRTPRPPPRPRPRPPIRHTPRRRLPRRLPIRRTRPRRPGTLIPHRNPTHQKYPQTELRPR